jgi:hypothetical protein
MVTEGVGREREAEEEWERKQEAKMREFDLGLAEHLDREHAVTEKGGEDG